MKKGDWQFDSGNPDLIGQEVRQVTKAFRSPSQLNCYLKDIPWIEVMIQKREIEVRFGKIGNGTKMVWEYALFRKVF
jgi:hypothetical protein